MSCPQSRKRLLDYALPYWRRLTLVLALSLVSTGLSLAVPYLSKDLVDRALLGRDAQALAAIVGLFVAITLAGFALNMASGLRYTRVSAEILFDMRLALYDHLQRLSPRFYARTRLGEIVSRINNDIGEIQRVAAESALAWVGNVLFLAGTVALLLWLDARLFLLSVALLPASVWALTHYRKRLEGRVATLRQTSADIGSFLIETLQGVKLVVTSNAQEREVRRFRGKNDAFIAALMSMQRLGYLAGGLPGLILSGSTVMTRSNPAFVPSASIEFNTISPAPSDTARLAHATASSPVGLRAPCENTSHLSGAIFRQSIETTMHWLPNFSAPSRMSSGRASALELMLILSAPARSIVYMSSTDLRPPPTVSGMKHWSAARSITSTIVARPCAVAVMSKNTISSAPCSL